MNFTERAEFEGLCGKIYLKVGKLAHLLHAVKVGIHMLLDSLDAVFQLAAHCAHELAEALNVFYSGTGNLHQATDIFVSPL